MASDDSEKPGTEKMKDEERAESEKMAKAEKEESEAMAKEEKAESEAMAEEEKAESKKMKDEEAAETEAMERDAEAAAKDSSDDDDSDDDAEDAKDDASDDEDADDEGEDEDEDEEEVAEKPAAKPVAAHKAGNGSGHAVAATAGHAHDDHEHGLAHVMSVRMLVGVWAGLMILTFLTVQATHFDLGGGYNLVVAMVIATIKAGMVCAFFMHLLYDKRFNLLIFMSGVLFLVLFISLALNDRREYEHDILNFQDQVAKDAVK